MAYRIRVGKNTYADPHYVTKVGDSPSFTSIFVNKKPRSWKKRSSVDKHLAQIKETFHSAEIEEYDE